MSEFPLKLELTNSSDSDSSIQEMFSPDNMASMDRLALPLYPGSMYKGIPVSSKDEDISDVIATTAPRGNFHIWAQTYIITFKYWLNKDDVINYYTNSLGAKICRVAHEIGTKKIDYYHSHVFLDFGKQFNSTNPRVFDACFRAMFTAQEWFTSDQPHPNIGPISKRKHLNRIYKYMCKYDHSNDDMLNWVTPDHVVEDIWGTQNVQDALRFATKFSDIPGILAAFQHKPVENKDLGKPPLLWQRTLLNMLESEEGSNRKIHWIYDQQGGMGKSEFARHAHSKFGKDILVMSQFGGARDSATVISNALDSGWTGKILIIDLPRAAETKSIYEPMEMIRNGLITSIKYNGKTHYFNNRWIIVLANFYPDVTTMTWDRWQIWDRSVDPEFFNTVAENNTATCNSYIPPCWERGDIKTFKSLKSCNAHANIVSQIADWPEADLISLEAQISHIRKIKQVDFTNPPMIPPDFP